MQRAVIMPGHFCMGFPDGSVVKNPPVSAGDAGLIPGSGRSLEKKMATHFTIFARKNPME